MIISGLEKLTKEDFEKIDIDYLEKLLLIVTDLYPIKSMGNKLNVSNIKDLEDFSFDLDNGSELVEVRVNQYTHVLSIIIFYRNCSFHYIYDYLKKKIEVSELYMNVNNLLLKHKMFNNEYMFERYNYDECSDTTIYFKNGELNMEEFIKRFIIENSDVIDCLDLLPKKYLKIKIQNPIESRYIEYRNSRLIKDVKGDSNGKDQL